ncbi:Pyridoxamine 5'-phosphate oxidase [Butyrivibrio fibrisolvens DSM 3071]|uniref:Pyridoxamine 5'-phosphate oxidase n=1 Tax=Butyrivibrio fibrisolvens DSM 3071 TaxID=1121131 RepID=A0A1M5V2V3_BUTFI|nr:pyridoxamine 5'-phosphate oxidase family protein [Butyrivibrio fibrisolvens]SHH69474.1 Pyridoxamine 5'-phosphate oxidase [Butyrivibrio fibrisolvens DSM 3071]
MDFDKAASFWERKNSESQMEDSELRGAIDAFVGRHKICALATGTGDFVRNTPIEYNYIGGKFWLFSEGGLKFRALKENKNVCLAIYEENPDFGCLHGMQIYGVAEVIEHFSDDYNKLLEYKKIPLDAVKKMEEPINLIKVVPKEIDFLNSDFKKNGFDSRQHLSL